MTIRRIRIACWIPMVTNTHSVCVILIAFPLQQRLHERASMLPYTYVACLVNFPLVLINICLLYMGVSENTRPILY
jgi:hypothetical protein